MDKIKVYSIWSEDEGDWFPRYLTADRKEAEDTIKEYVSHIGGCNNWIEDGLIYIVEAELDISKIKE